MNMRPARVPEPVRDDHGFQTVPANESSFQVHLEEINDVGILEMADLIRRIVWMPLIPAFPRNPFLPFQTVEYRPTVLAHSLEWTLVIDK